VSSTMMLMMMMNTLFMLAVGGFFVWQSGILAK
jgi:hypothetical protein